MSEKVHYQVNGEVLTTEEPTPTVREILEDAGAPASVDVREIGNYSLENLTAGKKYEDLDDRVPVGEGDKFVAIYRGKTPVA